MRTDAASSLPEDPALLKALAAEQQATITDLTRKLAQVEHYLAQLLRSKYDLSPLGVRVPIRITVLQPPEVGSDCQLAIEAPQRVKILREELENPLGKRTHADIGQVLGCRDDPADDGRLGLTLVH